MCRSFEMHRRSPRGWGYVRKRRSVEERFCTQRAGGSEAVLRRHFVWVLTPCITRKTTWVSSFDVSRASSANLKPLLQPPINWPALFHLLRTKEPCNESVFQRCEAETLKRAELRLRKQAAQLGFSVVPAVNE